VKHHELAPTQNFRRFFPYLRNYTVQRENCLRQEPLALSGRKFKIFENKTSRLS